MRLRSFYFTNRGGRPENEDSASALEKEGRGIFVVADGLGGHKHGSRASRCVVDSLLESWPKDCSEGECDPAAILYSGIEKANSAILQLQKENNSNMKSTVVALAIEGEQAAWANTGDSRLYFIHDGRIGAITADHSVAYIKYKNGEISRAQIAQDEDQSSLLKALGNERRWEPEVRSAQISSGDAFMLCSDGLWEYLRDEEILADSLKTDDPKRWAELLLVRLMGRIRPGNDNLTVLTVKVE